jgi:phage terminase Nu1 subunit (DNA packaging protein)
MESFGKKLDVAKMLNKSVRSVDNYLSQGCPHYKDSPRSVRFDMAEVKEWFKAKYGQQKRKDFDEQKSLTE